MIKYRELLKRYYVPIKYLFSAGIAFFIDLSLFTILSHSLAFVLSDSSIIVGTIIARIISSFVNYFINRNTVFKVNNNKIDNNTLLKYYILVIVQMVISATMVLFFHKLVHIDESIVKIPVDVLLCIINYFIQRNFIFINKNK